MWAVQWPGEDEESVSVTRAREEAKSKGEMRPDVTYKTLCVVVVCKIGKHTHTKCALADVIVMFSRQPVRSGV